MKPWLKKWKVLQGIGAGGQGLAELCVAPDSSGESKRYVLKRLNRQNDPERRARMHREVSALRTLCHRGLPAYVDGNTEEFASLGTSLYFVMEYIPGCTLDTTVRRARLELDAAVGLTLALVDIVDHCHVNGVVHRDIKPDNIILRDGDPAKPVLLDFGLTFNRENPGPHVTEASQHLGNRFLYLPELRGSAQEKRDARSDLTACCAILFFALTGETPTSLEDSAGAMPHQRATAQSALTSIPGARRVALNGIFDRGFRTPIGRRWQSADSLRHALERAAESVEGTTPEAPNVRLERLRANVEARPDHTHEARVREILLGVDRHIRSAQKSVVASLGSSFSELQGGYQLQVSRGLIGNTLGILRTNNSAEGVRPRFEGCVTGTELIVTATNTGQQVELLRVALEDPETLGGLEQSAVEYFVSELEKVFG